MAIYVYNKGTLKKTVVHDAKIARQAGYVAIVDKNDKGNYTLYTYRKQT